MKKIVIIDYGLSNLLSVKHAFDFFKANTIISQTAEDIKSADALVLPGVGAFKDGMNKLKELNILDAITQRVNEKTPLLGICLGMQMLFDESEEFGIHKGLGFIPGKVIKIPDVDINGNKQKVPHISWNPLLPGGNHQNFENSILSDIRNREECYFIHSFEAKPKFQDDCLAETEYGGRRICAVAQRNNVIGTQFHPEKSGEIGLRIIKQFIEMH